jgi:hypothetical protein
MSAKNFGRRVTRTFGVGNNCHNFTLQRKKEGYTKLGMRLKDEKIQQGRKHAQGKKRYCDLRQLLNADRV